MLEEIPRILVALIAVLAMIGGGALLAKRMGFAAPSAGLVGRKKRLSLVETMAVDARRRIAIIKCDDAEHLILLGATGETVIAHDIAGPSEETALESIDETISPLSALAKTFGQDAKKIA